MQVSVVVCTHTVDRYDALADAAESVLTGTYDDVELVLVSDGSRDVADLMRRDFGDDDRVAVRELDESSGLLVARNAGAEAATGDVIAFIDDDAVAASDWVERLVDAYEEHDRRAVGGKMVPRWVAGKPEFLPEEFYFLIGATHRGFGPNGDRDRAGEVRNGMGSNISFTAETFDALGGFEPNVGGRKGDNKLQGGETELCARLRREFGEGVWYVPDAVVEHKIYDYRTDPIWLLERAFWQGYSKRGMERFVPESTGEEGDFLKRLIGEYVPGRVKRLVSKPSLKKASQLGMLGALTGAVGVGYLYGVAKWRLTHSA